MAINAVVLHMLANLARQLPPPRRMLCLGYPDMLVTDAQIEKICGPEALAGVKYREDSDSILRWHALQGRMTRIPESRSLFEAIGLEADFVDLVVSRDVEIVLNLNQPAPPELAGRYDIVYDGGTMEHCFNVGQVMRNIFEFARIDGYIVHVNPLSYFDHGFFNFNPTFYYDWYTRSQNTVMVPFYAMHGPVLDSYLTEVPPVGAFAAPERAVLLIIAVRRQDATPDWPMQSKYLRHSELKG